MADKQKPQSTESRKTFARHPKAPIQSCETRKAPVGGLILADGDIELNAGRPTTKLTVRNTGDRPIQVGSHFHFFEVNRYLDFDRSQAFGKRLDIPSTTAIRFEPGDEKEVTLVPMSGKQFCVGFNNLVDGWTGVGPDPQFQPNFVEAMSKMLQQGFKSRKE